MTTFFTEVRLTLVPRGEVKHGPLPPLLVAMTLVAGLVDAFSYLVGNCAQCSNSFRIWL
jgi:hypothetical protein